MPLKSRSKRLAYFRTYNLVHRDERRLYRKRYQKKGYLLLRAYSDSLKATGCVDCGNKNLSVLDFDHVGDKKATISSMLTTLSTTFADLEGETRKCEVRCANCHRLKTADRLRQGIGVPWHTRQRTSV